MSLTPKADKEQLARFADELKRCGVEAGKMSDILGSFETRLASLDHRMKPIHTVTTSLNQAYSNIQSSISSITDFMQYFELYDQVQSILKEGISSHRADYAVYLTHFERAMEGLRVLSEHKAYKSAEKHITLLKKLVSQATADCEAEFRAELLTHSACLDPQKLPEPWPMHVEMLPAHIVSGLNRIAAQLRRAGSAAYRKTYRDLRSSMVEQSLALMQPDRMVDERHLSAASIRYERGSHRFLALTAFVALLLRSERELIDRVLGPGTEDLYWEVIEAGVDIYVATGARLIKAYRTPDRAPVLFDALRTVNEHMPELTRLLTSTGGKMFTTDVAEFNADLLKAARSVFPDMLSEVTEHVSRPAPPTATVSDITSNTLQRLARLIEHRDVVENLIPSTVLVGSAADAHTALGAFTVSVLKALEACLDTKSKAYPAAKGPAAPSLFLLNNYHYIVAHLRSAPVGAEIGLATLTRLEEKVQQHRAAYMASWDKLVALMKDLLAAPPMRPSPSRSERQAVKDKFKAWNQMFSDAHMAQIQLQIPDSALRAEMKAAVRAILVPSWSLIVEKYIRAPFTTDINKYIKFKPDTLETMIAQLFEGTVVK